MSRIRTVADFTKHVSRPHDSFVVNDDYEIHFIADPKPGTPFDVVGSVTYRTVSNQHIKISYFLLSQGSRKLYSKSQEEEHQIVRAIGEVLEQRWCMDKVQLVDIVLPTSHGFSHNRHHYPTSRK